jgi:hypothetical protein
MIASRSHPDVMWVEPRKKSRLISVDQIRELSQRMVQTSFEGGWKSAVIAGADRLGQEASNAFLKTLEEPSGSSVFFLVTDSPQFLLRTIVSRCQRIAISGSRVSLPADLTGQLVEMLEGTEGCGSERPGTIETFGWADRLVGLLKSIKGQIETDEKERAADSDEESQTIDARVNARYREIRSGIMRWILLWHRDILVSLNGAGDDIIFNAEHSSRIKNTAGQRELRDVLHNIRVVEAMNSQLERNLPESTVLALGLSSIR